MINKSKLYLGGIQEFRTATYVKDLKARKLDAHMQQDHFIRYDSESKGFRIYWPTKRSISVEWNVVFNGDDILEKENTTVTVGVQSEGEKDKVIQHPENTKQIKNQNKVEDEPQSLKVKKMTCLHLQKQLIWSSSHPDLNLQLKLKVKMMMKYNSMDEVIVHKSIKEHTEMNEGLTAALAH